MSDRFDIDRRHSERLRWSLVFCFTIGSASPPGCGWPSWPSSSRSSSSTSASCTGDQREIEVRESLILSAGYIGLALAFGAWVWWYLGSQSGMEYLTGFAIEKALAMDNVFVIAMIFAFFAVPRQYQHRVLFWGILGVIVLRAIMIGLGATIVSQFSWVLYVFAVFLILTGVKMLVFKDADYDVGKNPVLAFMRRRFNVTDEHHGEKFWVKKPDPPRASPSGS